MAKIGERFVDDMIDRGRREIGGLFYSDSNIAQPMYPLRGGYEVSKETESPASEEPGSIVNDRLKQAEINRHDPGRDDRGMERE
jgi:hypothetical protein